MRIASLPPLVEPGPPLSAAEHLRYARHLPLTEFGDVGQRRVRAARVLVVGAGGLGSPVLLYLAAAGVGTVGIVDPDIVDTTNLQRQILHGTADIGRLKTVSAAAAVAAVNPDVRVIEFAERLTSANAHEICSGFDVVIDGTDNFPTRYLVNDVCVLQGKPLVWGSILGFEGQVSVFWSAHGPHYRDVFPVPPPADSVPDCATGGVLGVLCGVVGSVMATEALKLIAGIGDSLLGRILFYDALKMSFRTIAVQADPEATPVTGLIDYAQFCGVPALTPPADATITAEELEVWMNGDAPPLVVDVREEVEHLRFAIPGSMLLPVGDITSAQSLELLRRHPAAVLYCQSGVRSGRALAALENVGLSGIRHLAGGVVAWLDRVEHDATGDAARVAAGPPVA